MYVQACNLHLNIVQANFLGNYIIQGNILCCWVTAA